MGFYEEIAPYYDYIFPAGEEQLGLISDAAGEPPKKMLDIACGTGAYSVRLAQAGHEVWALDADPEMIRLARLKAAGNNVHVSFFVGDMLELDKSIGSTEIKFDCIFCIGNSIVHLGSRDAVRNAVKKMKERLVPGGSIVLQIINFDRVLEKGVTSLPTLKNEDIGLVFERNYTRDEDTGLICFDTVLTVDEKAGQVRTGNRVKLFPLTSSMLEDILTTEGPGSFEFFGDFSKSPYIPGESFMLVAVAR
jgi:glycine/sarcosine N-methyltransferase